MPFKNIIGKCLRDFEELPINIISPIYFLLYHGKMVNTIA
jgi:hypothetical protein